MTCESRIYRVGTYFDGMSFRTGDFRLQVQNGCIAAMEPWELSGGNLGATPETPIDWTDLRQYVLVPPLADAHIHASLAPWPLALAERKSMVEDDPLAAGFLRVEKAAYAGVGWLRDGGDPKGVNLHSRAMFTQMAESGLPVPTYLVPGPALHSPGRYGSFLGQAVADREQMRQTITALQAAKVDFIKVLPTGIINFKTGTAAAQPQFSSGDLRYLVDVCHDSGLRVMAHASGEEGIRQAVLCGVDFVEHGYFIAPDILDAMAERNTPWTPTLAPVWVQMEYFTLCGWDVGVRDQLQRILDGHRESINRALVMGIDVLTGSDAGAPGVDQLGGIYLEMSLLQDAGLSSAALLHRSCQLTPSRLGGEAVQLWRPGAQARFLLAPQQVVNDVNALLETKSLVWDGKQHDYQPPQVHPVEVLASA